MSDKYTMQFPVELKRLLQEYIEKNPEIGFKKVSKLILHIVQEFAIEIMMKKKEQAEILRKLLENY